MHSGFSDSECFSKNSDNGNPFPLLKEVRSLFTCSESGYPFPLTSVRDIELSTDNWRSSVGFQRVLINRFSQISFFQTVLTEARSNACFFIDKNNRKTFSAHVAQENWREGSSSFMWRFFAQNDCLEGDDDTSNRLSWKFNIFNVLKLISLK